MGAASFVLFYEKSRLQLPKLSNTFRQVFMALIGAIIGTRFSPELFQILPDFWISALALIPFILIVHSGSYLIMRKISGHSRRDTFFATMPAGIIDAVALAEQMGADLKIVATQHFVRVVIVVTLVPLLFLIIDGNAVGSAAGMSMANSNYTVTDVISLCLIASELTSFSFIFPAVPKKVHIVLSESGVTNIRQVPVGNSSFFFE